MQASDKGPVEGDRERELAHAVGRVAALIEDIDAFEAAALELAEALTPPVEVLERLLHHPPELPDGPAPGWASAVCEVLYNSGEAAVDVLGRAARASGGPAALEAVRTLARLAWHDIDTAEALGWLSAGSAEWDDVLAQHALGFLTPLAGRSPEVVVLVDDLMQRAVASGQTETVLSGLESLARWYPRALGMYAAVLKELVAPALDGETPDTEDFEAIRAAMLLIRARPTDGDARRPLQWWAMHHPDAGVRRAVVEALRDAS